MDFANVETESFRTLSESSQLRSSRLLFTRTRNCSCRHFLMMKKWRMTRTKSVDSNALLSLSRLDGKGRFQRVRAHARFCYNKQGDDCYDENQDDYHHEHID
jgi:hypothetical protein